MMIKCKVIIREDKTVGQWVARGLEYDICSQGDSIKSAIHNFCELFCLEYELSDHLNQKFEDRIPKAPQHLWDIYKENYKNIHSTELPNVPLESPDIPWNKNIPEGTLTPRLVIA